MRRNARSLAEIRARITREEMRRRSRVKSVEECACFRPQFDDVMLANTEREINGNNLKCKVKQRENYHLRLNFFVKGQKMPPNLRGTAAAIFHLENRKVHLTSEPIFDHFFEPIQIEVELFCR